MNEIHNQVSKIIKSLVLCLSVGIGGGMVVGIIAGIITLASGSTMSTPAGIFVAVMMLSWVVILIWSYVMYLMGIRGFGKRIDAIGNRAMACVFWANLIPIIGYLASLPLFFVSLYVAGPVLALSILAALVLVTMGYWNLPSSTSLNQLGVKGAKMLRTAMILNLVSAVAGWIYIISMLPALWNSVYLTAPLSAQTALVSSGLAAIIGLCCFAMFVLGILSLIFTFVGWGQIRRSFAN